jgi:hypothetical protein
MSTGQPASRPHGGAGADDVRADIERTRQQLGETVEALAAKADVKARARQKVTEAREQAAGRVTRLRKQAAGRAGQAAGLAGHATSRAGQAAGLAGQATARAGQATARAGQATAAGRRDNRAALAAAAAAVGFSFIAVMLWRRGGCLNLAQRARPLQR